MKLESSFGILLQPAQVARSEAAFAKGPVTLRWKRCVHVNPYLCMIFQHADNESPILKRPIMPMKY